MAESPRKILICSCDDTMPLDEGAVKRGCRGAEVLDGASALPAGAGKIPQGGCGRRADHCRLHAGGAAVRRSRRAMRDIRFVNIRETAGWSKDAKAAGPKMAALIAAAAEPPAETAYVSFESEGVLLIYGRDEAAIEAAALLKDHLDVTVLIKPPADIAPPRVTEFPVVKGTIRSAKGHLGAFELIVDDYAQPAPSSRGALTFGAAKDGAKSRCDLILDISGGAPLFSAADLRDGYLRADPGDPAAVMKAVLKARDLTGTFDKPRYINFNADICAHSRSKIVGCNRCLDLCPAGAIAPDGDHVDDRRPYLRGLRAMRGGVSDRRRLLRAADRRCADAQAAHAAHDLSRGRRRAAGRAVPRRRARHAADRRAGAFRRRAAGECAAGRGQRGDAGRARGARRRVCLWRRRRCGCCCAPSRAMT